MKNKWLLLDANSLARFWGKTKRTKGCWIWTGSTCCGYGQFSTNGRMLKAHRVSWLIHNGSIPEGLCVLHNCPGGDNPACVNPDHLWLGTFGENNSDRAAKGRNGDTSGDKNGSRTHPESGPRGEKHGSKTHPERLARGDRNGSRKHPECLVRGSKRKGSKLTEKKVERIRTLYANGTWSANDLSRLYGVHVRVVYKAISGETWGHVS